MAAKEIVDVLEEIRRGQGMSTEVLAKRTGKSPEEIAAFFGGAAEEPFARAVAEALGLRTDRYETCAGAVIDYYKNGIYFSSEEMQMIRYFRGADACVRERLLALLAVL